MSEKSEVPDHCAIYALSDSKVKDLQGNSCSSGHRDVCSRCEDFKDLSIIITKAVQESEFRSEEEKDDLKYVTREAVQAIELWKAHQLRSVRQDKCRTDVIALLDEKTVFITQDWAMKFLPRKYRESQTDWFGKRGVSWHISVVVQRINENLQTKSFIHVADNCSQDSWTVIRIMQHVLACLKKENNDLEGAYFRQDNAGCYHSSSTILACRTITKQTRVKIIRCDFSDPQGGKGPCDRLAAAAKSHIKFYVNEGHDVTNAEELTTALKSNGGLQGVHVVRVDAGGLSPLEGEHQPKFEGISLYNNFKFSEVGITVWRAYNIGAGKFFAWSQLKGK